MKRLTIILAVVCVAVAVAMASPVWADRGCSPRSSFGLSIGFGGGYHGSSLDFGYSRGYYRPYAGYGYYDCGPYRPSYRSYRYRTYRYDPYPRRYRYSHRRSYRYRDRCDW